MRYIVNEFYPCGEQKADKSYCSENFLGKLNNLGDRQKDSPPFHPRFRCTSMDYGWYAPTIYTAPTVYYPKNTNFSSELMRSGTYRNYSLNTELDKTLF